MQTEGKFTTYDVYHRYSGLLEKKITKSFLSSFCSALLNFLVHVYVNNVVCIILKEARITAQFVSYLISRTLSFFFFSVLHTF